VGFFVEPHIAVMANHSLDNGGKARPDRGSEPYLIDVIFYGEMEQEHVVHGKMEVVYRDFKSDVAVLATQEGTLGS
jgi:hypothetical protein